MRLEVRGCEGFVRRDGRTGAEQSWMGGEAGSEGDRDAREDLQRADVSADQRVCEGAVAYLSVGR
jgi:hypothetical protein